jgi:hypothetical protein
VRRSRGPTALGYFCRLGYGRGAAARRVLASGRFGRRGRLEMRLGPGGVWRILELDSREGARPCCGLDGLARGYVVVLASYRRSRSLRRSVCCGWGFVFAFFSGVWEARSS